MCRRRHVVTSYNFAGLFGYDMERVAEEDTAYFNRHIHPGDMPELMRNGTAVLRYFMERSDRRELAQTKMINEYRIEAQGRYVRVIEQFRVLEFDTRGNVWLSLSVLDVSPNQTPLNGVQSKLMNCRTGAVYLLPEFAAPDAPRLSPRERRVLALVRDGLLSKEISEQLAISVHTVNTHRQRILEKLNADNSMEAVRYAQRLGLLE